MPPTGPLSQSEIAALEQWVRAGAVWPQPRAVRKQNGERQGGVVARSPGDGEWAAELQVWLKADAIQLKEGETLQAWPDASGRGNHWKVPTVEAPPREAPAPEWIADSRVHGKPALRFEGPSRLAGPDTFLAKDSEAVRTALVVARFEPGDKGGGAGRSGAVPGGKRPLDYRHDPPGRDGGRRHPLLPQRTGGGGCSGGPIPAGRGIRRPDLVPGRPGGSDPLRHRPHRGGTPVGRGLPGGQIRHSASLEPGRDRRRVCRGRKVLLGLPARDPAGASPSSGPGVAPHLAGPVHPGQAGGRGASAGSAGGPAEADSPAHLQPGGSAAGTRGG